MAQLIEIRALKSGGGIYETRPGIREVLTCTEGETLHVSPALADIWTGAGIAERVTDSRNVEVETAMRVPRTERAVRRRK